MNWMNVVFWLIGTLVVMLGPMLMMHELAHFLVAKLAGVRVEEFGLGFPPRLLGLWRGRGYLAIGETRIEIPRAFNLPRSLEQGDWVKAVASRRRDGRPVLEQIEILPSDQERSAPVAEMRNGKAITRGPVSELERGTLYSLNLLPMGAFVRMTGEEDPSDPRSLAAQPRFWRAAVMLAGPLTNIFVAVMLLFGAYRSGFPTDWHVKITRVEPDTAASEAGLQSGDLVMAADGEPIDEGLAELRSIIRSAPEEPIRMQIVRDGETLSLVAVPEVREDHGFLGIMMSPWPDRTGLQRYSPIGALRATGADLLTIVRRTLELPVRLLRGNISSQEARPTSLVGISQIMTFSLQQSIEWGLAFPALQTASLISLALGLTNLLPLPALDGGRLLFVIIESIRGKRISPEREAIVHFVGMLILVGLMILVMLQDLINPIIPWSLLR